MLGEKDLLFNISNIISVTPGMLVHIACAHHCTAHNLFHSVNSHLVLSVYVVVNFLSQVIFVFLLFLGMVMYANEIETKEK